MRLQDIQIGDLVAIRPDHARRRRHEEDRRLPDGLVTYAVVECEDEHVFEILPADLEPYERAERRAAS